MLEVNSRVAIALEHMSNELLHLDNEAGAGESRTPPSSIHDIGEVTQKLFTTWERPLVEGSNGVLRVNGSVGTQAIADLEQDLAVFRGILANPGKTAVSAEPGMVVGEVREPQLATAEATLRIGEVTELKEYQVQKTVATVTHEDSIDPQTTRIIRGGGTYTLTHTVDTGSPRQEIFSLKAPGRQEAIVIYKAGNGVDIPSTASITIKRDITHDGKKAMFGNVRLQANLPSSPAAA